MKDRRDELLHMLEEMPVYKSWSIVELDRMNRRYREIVQDLVTMSEYRKFKWIADRGPDLDDRIQQMASEKNVDKQARQFNNIVFVLQNAIEILTGAIEISQRDWEILVSHKLSLTG